MAILDSAVSHFVSRRFVVCDKGEYLRNAMNMIERCAASYILVMDRETMVGLVAHRQVRGFVQLATEVN
jgi:predicted transcriptional regulator